MGTRALGMGGAFVAVADDGSAVYWNPAGLALGPFFELRFEGHSAQNDPDGRRRSDVAIARARSSSQFFSISIPAVGLSYYRLREAGVTPQPVQLPTTAESVRDRENQGPARIDLGSIVTHHFGLTLVQTLSDRLAVGTTVRAVIGSAGSGPLNDAGGAVPSPLDQAADLDRTASGSFDVDAGALATFGPARAGVVVRNLRASRFEAPPLDYARGALSGSRRAGAAPRTFEFGREVRVGVALMPDQGRRANPTTVALDVDLTRQRSLTSERRNVAVGAEQWLMNRRVGIRGGVRASMIGEARPIVSGGASVMVRSSVLIETHVSGGIRRNGTGRADEGRGWSLAARVSF
ncbi:MAG: conjugal transfer protein TraF [Acidobacteria bacterium]|nr:conjugal transfer protein TraF [Acidobacteriota bacterium]